MHRNPNTTIPKYRQIIQYVMDSIDRGALKRGDLLPSINEVCATFAVSRDTAVKAYRQLKKMGMLKSVHGKGFYINSDGYIGRKRVFVLFDELANPYKTCLYEAINEGVEEKADLNVFFHHYNSDLYVRLLREAKDSYEYYVVMTYANELILRELATLDQDRLLILDQFNDYPGRACAVINQDFVEQQAEALAQGLDRIRRYESLTLVFPKDRNHPSSVKKGFRLFCRRYRIQGLVVSQLKADDIKKGHAYFVIEDSDLVTLVKTRQARKLEAGRDIGILSYNEIPFKEIVDNRIAVISTDFHAMGARAARQILEHKSIFWTCPTRLIARDSL